MTGRGFPSVTDQVVAVLRKGMASGRWRGTLPGRDRLAQELAVNHKTVEEAMRRLSGEGWLVSQGGGRRRRIVLPEGESGQGVLRVRILLYDRDSRAEPDSLVLIDELRTAGFAADFAMKTLGDLKMDVERLARFVAKTPADAWVVQSGSRQVLEWFSEQKVPAIAMFGRFTGLPIAASCPRKAPALVEAVRHLADLGHRRIVMITHGERRKPYPALFEQTFLDELEARGIATGPYNLPDWNDKPDGLRACLDGLFRHTPPTAIILSEARLFVATQQYLARRGIHAPEHVSLICDDPDPSFSWCEPTVSHLRWDSGPVVKRVVRWAKNIARGKEDKRQELFDGEFVEGGTIGPPVGVKSREWPADDQLLPDPS